MKKPLQSIEIICDSCNFSFDHTALNIKEDSVKLCGDKVRVIYYRCPNCGKLYLIAIHNYTSDKMIKRQKELIASNQKRVKKGLPVSAEKLDQIERIKEDLLSYQDALRERYKRDIHLLDHILKNK